MALLVHGASGNSADMEAALGERLRAEGFRTLSVDRPGHGWSDRVAGRAASSPERQADMLRRAAERLGVAQAVIVAHSLAGVTGLALALNAPEFVRALLLVAPVSHPWPGGVACYYSLGAHPLFGPPFRRLLATPAALALMRPGVRIVFKPNPAPPDFIQAPRLPLLLRPLHFGANCEDVVAMQAAVAALRRHSRPDRNQHRRLRSDRLRPHPQGRLRPRHSRRPADDARQYRPFAALRRPRPDRGDRHCGGAARERARKGRGVDVMAATARW